MASSSSTRRMVEESAMTRSARRAHASVGPSPYYSPGMAVRSPRAGRRRPRPGSLERPVNARMYRGTWLLVGLPLLLAAFTLGRAQPLAPPTLPQEFDRVTARALAADFARAHPDRTPGTEGGERAADWVARQLRPYGLRPQRRHF